MHTPASSMVRLVASGGRASFLFLKKRTKKGGVGVGLAWFDLALRYLTAALKDLPQLGHLYSPTVRGFLPFGARVQVFSGFSTSVPHFPHFAIETPSIP